MNLLMNNKIKWRRYEYDREKWLFLRTLYQDHTKNDFDLLKALRMMKSYIPEQALLSLDNFRKFYFYMRCGWNIFYIEYKKQMAFALSLTYIITEYKSILDTVKTLKHSKIII